MKTDLQSNILALYEQNNEQYIFVSMVCFFQLEGVA